MRKYFRILSIGGLFLGLFSLFGMVSNLQAVDIPEPGAAPESAGPLLDWSWMGCTITDREIWRNIDQFHEKGLAGAAILPIYGVKGEESIPFLSPEWMVRLKKAAKEAQEKGMSLDMSQTSGWPFGGPCVAPEDVAWRMRLEKKPIAGLDFSQWYAEREKGGETFVAFSVYGPDGERLATVSEGNPKDWSENLASMPEDASAVFLLKRPTGMQVKRAAPGGEGPTLDYYSRDAFIRYTEYYQKLFEEAEIPNGAIRAFMNDSFENYSSDWTGTLPEVFRAKRGYDLFEHLDALENPSTPENKRIYADYLETVSDLLYDAISAWTEKAAEMGVVTRYQAHGSPGNLIDLYALSAIPETEVFGSCDFKIPGYEPDPDFDSKTFGSPDYFMIKFASSGGNLGGSQFVSSETGTWIADHFKTTMAMLRSEIDLLFAAGINQIAYHQGAFTPQNDTFPGNVPYYTLNVTRFSHFWNHFHLLNQYVRNCQSILQQTKADNDLLLYFPIHDFWADQPQLYLFTVHAAPQWLHRRPIGRMAKTLEKAGYSFDYVSDQMLQKTACADAEGVTCGNAGLHYRGIVVPECDCMPLETLRVLADLAKQGVPVFFEKKIPTDVPGYFQYQERQNDAEKTAEDFADSAVVETDEITAALEQAQIFGEEFPARGLNFIRKTDGESTFYFLANLSDEFQSGSVRLQKTGRFITIYDPLEETHGAVTPNENGEIFLSLAPGTSCFIRTSDTAEDSQSWTETVRMPEQAVSIGTDWSLAPLAGEPARPGTCDLEKLDTWTRLPDSRWYFFSGKARYAKIFTFDADSISEPFDGLELVFDKIDEIAEITLNGQKLGCIWSLPPRMKIPKEFFQKENTLIVDVTNSEFNRIIDMDRRGGEWKKFEDTNVVNIRYQPFDASDSAAVSSGISGDVRLIPYRNETTDHSSNR